MGVKKDSAGRRYVEVEVEVSGTPEEVWAAIASGEGISSWFVPTEFEYDADGNPAKVVSHFDPSGTMDSVARVTAWSPPHGFTAESEDLGPGAPPVATEWIVEAREGGRCVVRVVHSLFTSDENWDNQLGMWEHGWPWFFKILRLYLAHFSGQLCASFRVMGRGAGTAREAWSGFTTLLGLSGAVQGDWRESEDAPPFKGVVDDFGDSDYHLAYLLRLEDPAPGIASAFALPLGEQVYLVIDFFLYGDSGADAAARVAPLWREWMEERYPMGGG